MFVPWRCYHHGWSCVRYGESEFPQSPMVNWSTLGGGTLGHKRCPNDTVVLLSTKKSSGAVTTLYGILMTTPSTGHDAESHTS